MQESAPASDLLSGLVSASLSDLASAAASGLASAAASGLAWAAASASTLAPVLVPQLAAEWGSESAPSLAVPWDSGLAAA